MTIGSHNRLAENVGKCKQTRNGLFLMFFPKRAAANDSKQPIADFHCREAALLLVGCAVRTTAYDDRPGAHGAPYGMYRFQVGSVSASDR